MSVKQDGAIRTRSTSNYVARPYVYIYIYISYLHLINRFIDDWALILLPPCSSTEDAHPTSAKGSAAPGSGKIGLFEDSTNDVGRGDGASNDDFVTYLVSTTWVTTDLQWTCTRHTLSLTTMFCSRVCVVHYVVCFISYLSDDEPVLRWMSRPLTLQIIHSSWPIINVISTEIYLPPIE